MAVRTGSGSYQGTYNGPAPDAAPSLYTPVRDFQPAPARTNAHPAHILIKADPGQHFWEQWEERFPKTVYKRPWKGGKDPKKEDLKGRVYTVRNDPVETHERNPVTGKAVTHTFAPLLIAMYALPEAEKISADWVRIITPTDPDHPANAAFEHRAYKVPDLQDMVLRWGKENGLLPEQRGRIINMGTDGPSPMPRRYRISDGGILYQD